MHKRKLFFLLVIAGVFISLKSTGQTWKVHFIIQELPGKNQAGASIFLAGSMNNWNPADSNYRFRKNADDQYELAVNLPEGVNEYKITQGSWTTVETN